MSEHRPFPPSPRRLALARRAGLTAASPLVVAAAACAAALAAIAVLARSAVAMLGGWVAAACAGTPALSAAAAPRAVLAVAGPILGSAALGACVGHLAQTRTLWLPRRRVPDAPAIAPRRTARAAGELASAAAIGAVCLGWLWWAAPRLAALFEAPRLGAGAALVVSFVAALATAWTVLGVLDALARHVALARALAMTPAEKRADDRLAAADPRWAARRLALARGPTPEAAVARAALVLAGDDAAVAIAWDPARVPVPERTASGRGPRATQLLALARRYRVPIHRAPALVAALAGGDGPVPERDWARLAEIVAAVRARA